jgi:ADP-heptose:LPS heptosyltransferase
MEAGKEYLCTNAFVGMMMQSPWRVITNGEMWRLRLLLQAEPYNEEDPAIFNPHDNWDNKDIWLIRGGGWGDLLMLTPTIIKLKQLWPKSRIHIACGGRHHGLFKGLDVIEELLPIPMNEIEKDVTRIISFEDIVEGTPDGIKYHMAQLLANKCGITLNNLRPHYIVSEKEQRWAEKKFPRPYGKFAPRIAVQFLASALYRSYPAMQKVVINLSKVADVFLFGAPGQVTLKTAIPDVTNLMEQKLTFRKSAAILETCDSCVSPDSALVHLCSALGIPCVALYGPFPAELRISSMSTTALQGHAPCAPCFFHADRPDQFPAGMPCTKIGRCVAMESINSDAVIATALELARGVDKHPLTVVNSL